MMLRRNMRHIQVGALSIGGDATYKRLTMSGGTHSMTGIFTYRRPSRVGTDPSVRGATPVTPPGGPIFMNSRYAILVDSGFFSTKCVVAATLFHPSYFGIAGKK